MCLALLCMGGLTPSARAQVDAVPKELIESKVPLSAEQVETVRKYADKYLSQLADSVNKPVESPAGDQAKQMLCEPLNRMGVATAFRTEYSKLIIGRVQEFSRNQNPSLAIAGLVIAGDLATAESLSVIEAQLSAKDDGTRLQAAAAMRRTFEAVRLSDPAVVVDRLVTALGAVGAALAKETDPHIVYTLTEAAIAGLRIDRATHEQVRSKATVVLSDTLGGKIRELSGAVPEQQTLFALVKAATEIRSALGATGQLDGVAAKAAAGFAGDLLLNISKVIEKGGLRAEPADQNTERAVAVQLAQLSEQIVTLAKAKLGDQQPAPPGLSNQLRPGTVKEDATFGLEVKKMVGQLTQPPFGLPAERFK